MKSDPRCWKRWLENRGGVEDTRLEDTRLEATAKDTKKIRGQGQPFRGQTLSRPRTGMLEVKAKDTSASAFQKKRSSQKFSGDLQKKKKKIFTKIFQAISTKKRFSKTFLSAPQNFNNSKNSAVLEPKTGQFSRTWGLEAMAKDLTFEAKTKDFKICPQGRPRGQGRPGGLHLCWRRNSLVNASVSSCVEAWQNSQRLANRCDYSDIQERKSQAMYKLQRNITP